MSTPVLLIDPSRDSPKCNIVRERHRMRGLKFLMLAAALLVPLALVPRANAQVTINIGVPPLCSYGYYGYAPYACAPSGYYGPGYFYNGIFLGMDRGKTGDTTTVGEVIVSRALEAVTITADMDIREAEVPPIRVGTRPLTTPDRRTMAVPLTPQSCTPMEPRTIALTPQLCIPMEAPLIAAVHTQKLLIPVAVPHIATAVTPKRRTTAGESHGGGGEHH